MIYSFREGCGEKVKTKILSFGEIIWDVFGQDYKIGGAPLNFVAHAIKSGAQGFLLSAVGDDKEGQMARNELARLKIDDRFVSTIQGKQTGRCLVSLDEKGCGQYNLLSDVAYDYIPFASELEKESFDAFSFGTLALWEKFNRKTLKKVLSFKICKMVYFDLNLRASFYTNELVKFGLENADIVKLNQEELDIVREMFDLNGEDKESLIKQLMARFVNLKITLLTLAEEGSLAYERETDSFTYCDAIKTEVVSTVGAGDSFGATFLTAFLNGKDIKTCLQEGAKRSAVVVSCVEAVPDEV